MKRHLSILACLVLVLTFVFSLASCDVVNKILGKTPETEHTHSFVEGKCECGETDPNYVPPHVHNFVEGECECGATDPNYKPEPPVEPVYYVVTEGMGGGSELLITITLKEGNVAVIHHEYQGDFNWTYTIGEDGKAKFLNEEGVNPDYPGIMEYSLTFVDGVAAFLEWESNEWPLVTEFIPDEGDDEGDDEGGADIVADAYIEDEISNTVTITEEMIAAGQAILSFVPSYTGEYTFNSMLLWVDGVKDSNGNIVETNDSGYYELTEYSTYYVFVPLAYMTAGDYSITPEYQYPEGHYENPFYFGYDYVLGSDIVVNYAGNWAPVWYSYTPDADGTITLTSATEHAIFNIGGIDYESTASLSVMGGNTYKIGIASNYEDDNFNNPACDITFSLNFEEGEYVGNGTQITPNVLTIGTNSAVSDYCTQTYFIYKATANGVLTIDSAQELFVLQFDGQYIDEDGINGNSLRVYDGGIYYVIVGVDDWENYVEYEFTASFKADPTEAWFEDTLVTDGSAANAIVIPDNSYVVIGVGQGTYTISWDVADAILVNPDTNAPYVNGSTITNEGWYLPIKIYLPDYAAGTVNVTISKVKEEAPATDLVLGNNNIQQKDYKYVYTATVDGELTLNVTAAMMGSVVITYTINDGEAQTFFDNATMSTPCKTVITLAANDKIVIDVVAAGYATLQASFAVPPTEIPGQLSNLGANEFTLTENSYVLIPLQVMGLYEITWENAIVEYKESGRAPFVKISSGAVANLNPMAGAQLKVYLENYAAGTATINVAEYVDTPVDAVVGDNTVKVVDTSFGKVVNLPVSDADVTYVVTPGNNAVVVYEYENFFDAVEITVAAGATVSFNVCTENFAAAEVVVNVAIKGQETETPVASATGTYMSDKHASGRYLKVEIDAENGTMTLTRSNMSGGWDASTSVAEYTYAFDGTNVTVTNVSGQVCTCVFDANGVPTSITWGSAIFVNFAKQ